MCSRPFFNPYQREGKRRASNELFEQSIPPPSARRPDSCNCMQQTPVKLRANRFKNTIVRVSVWGGQTTLAGSLGHLTQLRSNERVNIVRIWQQKMLGERSVISSLKAFTVSMGRQPCRQSVMNFRVISLHPHADRPLPMAGYQSILEHVSLP